MALSSQLFPLRLEEVCDQRLLRLLQVAGLDQEEVHLRAWQHLLITHLASNVLDRLLRLAVDQLMLLRAKRSDEHGQVNLKPALFTLMALANSRATSLVLQPPSSLSTLSSSLSTLSSSMSSMSSLSMVCVAEMSSLQVLCVCVGDDALLQLLSTHCPQLQCLEVSDSSLIKDVGLLALCNMATSDEFQPARGSGCPLLRDLRLIGNDQVSVAAVACALRRLRRLEVFEVFNLCEAIEVLAVSQSEKSCGKRLRLKHCVGLASTIVEKSHILDVRMRSFVVHVDHINVLHHLEGVLAHLQVNKLVINLSATQKLKDILQLCSHFLCELTINFDPNNTDTTNVECQDVLTIMDLCGCNLETLTLRSPHIASTSSTALLSMSKVSNFHFLTDLTLLEVRVSRAELLVFVLKRCDSLERLSVEFVARASFFDDFVLDHLLEVEALPRLQSFLIVQVSLTLISALRLISSRPKVRRIGRLDSWDVEENEKKAFVNLIKKAYAQRTLQAQVHFL